MRIEDEIFQKTSVDFEKLEIYGFRKVEDCYQWSKNIMNDEFQIVISIDFDGHVSGKIYDLQVCEEYTSFRIVGSKGGFASNIKDIYCATLREIRERCFQKQYFQTEQSNRIAYNVTRKYQEEIEFLWEKFPGYGIFRNRHNRKWYAVIMEIDRFKLDKSVHQNMEIINVKVDPDTVMQHLNQGGIYPAYHMNKKHWISIFLDETFSDGEIMEYIKKSRMYTELTNKKRGIDGKDSIRNSKVN